MLQIAKQFIQDGMNPQFLIKTFKKSNLLLQGYLDQLAIHFTEDNAEKRQMIIKCAETSLNSKLLSHYKTFFAEMVVQAVEKLDKNLMDKDLIGIKQVVGGSI